MNKSSVTDQFEVENWTSFVCSQINFLCPDGSDLKDEVRVILPIALQKAKKCVGRIKPWNENSIDRMISWQYATFLYFLSRQAYKNGMVQEATKIFLLNKALNGIELFYEIEMPDVFFLSHTVGAVFSKAEYGEMCVFHQNCTVGRSNRGRPSLEKGVVMLPNSMIIGHCLVRENTVIAPGVTLVDTDTPGNCYVFHGHDGKPKIKSMNKKYYEYYFDIEN